MSLSMYQASVPAFLQMLNNLSAILDKAEAYAGNRKIDPEVLLNYRLAPDMLPFIRQIQIAADLAKGAAARLAGPARRRGRDRPVVRRRGREGRHADRQCGGRPLSAGRRAPGQHEEQRDIQPWAGKLPCRRPRRRLSCRG